MVRNISKKVLTATGCGDLLWLVNSELRLYVWREFAPDYFNGLAVAVARDEGGARQLVIENAGYNPSDWGPVQVLELNQPQAFAVSGGS